MSRTHNLPYSWQDNGEKWPFFYGILTLFLTFFIDCGHIYIPKGVFGVLSTSRPHRGDLVMSLIFTLGPTTHDWGWLKMVHFGPKMAKQKGPNGQTTRQTLIYVFLRAPDCWHPLTRVNKTLLCISSLSSRPAASWSSLLAIFADAEVSSIVIGSKPTSSPHLIFLLLVGMVIMIKIVIKVEMVIMVTKLLPI